MVVENFLVSYSEDSGLESTTQVFPSAKKMVAKTAAIRDLSDISDAVLKTTKFTIRMV